MTFRGDAGCQDVADRLAEAAESERPDAEVLFASSEPSAGTIWATIHLGPVEETLADQRAGLVCEQQGFTIQVDAADGQATPLAFVSTPMDIAVAGWDVVARSTSSPAGDTTGETVSVVAGRDGVLVALQLTAGSVPAARAEGLTSVALQRADAVLLDSQQ